MRRLKLLILVSLLFCFSCEDSDLELIKQDEIHTITLNHYDKTSKKKDKIKTLEIEFNFRNPLLSKSETLIVKEAMNEKTQKMGYIIVPKQSILRRSVTEVIIEEGHFFDGDCCFLYGTWVTDTESGVSLFVREQDLATQSLMDNCGYCNVA